MTSPYLRVAQAIAAHVVSLSPEGSDLDGQARHLLRAVQSAAPRAGFTVPATRDHEALLAAAVAAGVDQPAAAIATALLAMGEPLPWHYHYERRDDAPDLATRIGFAELIGPRGPLTAPDCRVGFTLMAADTFYPLHRHPAVELYLVISGIAEWITPPTQRLVPPGECILHASNQLHAMRTTRDPLLALYAWSGDLVTPATYL